MPLRTDNNFDGKQGSNGQWQIGPTAMFHWGIGLLPYKDTFFSNTTMAQVRPPGTNKSQWPPFYNYHESDPSTHALMAVRLQVGGWGDSRPVTTAAYCCL